jgi:flagellar hook-length control protein FliK
LLADPVIAPLSNTIAVKTTAANPSPGSGDAFGQILQCAQDAAPVPITKSTPDTPIPQVPAASAATPPPLPVTPADAVTATPKMGKRPSIAAAGGADAPPAKPARALRNDGNAGGWQAVDQTAAVPAPAVDPTAVTAAMAATVPNQVSGAPAVSCSAPVVDEATGSAAATPALPSSSGAIDPKAGPGGVAAPPEPTPAAASGAAVVSASEHASAESIQAGVPNASALRELMNLAAGQGTARPGSDIQRPRSVENASSSRQTTTMTARRGAVPQALPELVADGAGRREIPSASPPHALAQAPEADGVRPRGPGADNGITLRPVEAAADPLPTIGLSSPAPQQVVPIDFSAAMPAAASAAPPTGAHAGNPVPVADQVGPALMTLAKSTDGSQETTIRLRPAELGSVQIRIARAASGATRIEILAEKSATLLTLQRDQPQLHRTLDEAGIPAAGRAITFHVVAANQPTNKDGSWNGPAGLHGPAAHTYAEADGSASGGKGNNAARQPNTYSNRGRAASQAGTAAANSGTVTQSYHIGLDITA